MIAQGFQLVYAPQVLEHLRWIERRHYGLIQTAIEQQLRFEPDTETTNRKPLERPSALFGSWELRLGPQNRFRVLYDVHRERQEVHVLAIGEKRRNRLRIGGQEVEL